ncbi:hypothetical protein SU69_05140 [Thermosipho melanesiensis]|uniref:Uncharacterized protein n=2 Tax=Thermosipho melanesiensis TaxID=46541 RepID=A6LLR4_THEM4|nr:DUF6115 domain-containing protein [Thermosipho melanesiensis]ABR30865.1 hypothetical protein Tmel_1004 [Thermosipho melanesiensis BI429]APT73984.1 hypothetical protein BW47_05380 [Thermosipho melanesiensis]OOC35915.1 hypothetical protein SU68_05195 [Thermosipho melanesiensis]OOC38417.1 hypothetical protein SU69_05140 [Thermosipho melanesiensis]OOC38878.1 hypothetical protein SU70_05140 [Thermosipho melanesiensis]
MNLIEWLILFSTISSVSFAWGIYLLNVFSSKNQPEKLKEDEERLIQLMGRVKTFVDSKLDVLDKKMEEVNNLITEINDLYSKVLLDLSTIENKKEKVNKEIETPHTEKEITKQPNTEPVKAQKEKTLEEKIIDLYNVGTDEAEIAKRFGIGIGEVRLIIDLFVRSKGGKL